MAKIDPRAETTEEHSSLSRDCALAHTQCELVTCLCDPTSLYNQFCSIPKALNRIVFNSHQPIKRRHQTCQTGQQPGIVEKHVQKKTTKYKVG